MIDKIKKVLFILPKDIGGAQKMTIVISQLLPKEQYNIKYLVVGKRNCTDMCYLINGQSNIEYLNILNAWDFLTLRLVKILHKEKPDIVFSSLMYLNIRVILAAKIIGGIKVIVRNDNMLKGIRKSMFLLLTPMTICCRGFMSILFASCRPMGWTYLCLTASRASCRRRRGCFSAARLLRTRPKKATL